MTAFSNRITWFSFILTVMVIPVHAVCPDMAELIGMKGASALQFALGTVLGQIAVPGFFCVSGYLFFRNFNELYLRKQSYPAVFIGKWKSRLMSLVLPYIVWNIIYYVVYIAAGKAVLSPGALIAAAVGHSYNPVFWYLKELIIITVLTPLIYICVRRPGRAAAFIIALFAAAVMYDRIPIHIANEDALFYYSAGAAAALHMRRTAESPEKYYSLLCAGLMAVIFIISEILLYGGICGQRAMLIGAVAGRMSGVIGIYALISLSTRTAQSPAGFMHYNFFIYAVHYLVIRVLRNIYGIIGMGTFLAETLGYLMMPPLCIATAVWIGSFLRHRLPGLYAVLSGKRS